MSGRAYIGARRELLGVIFATRESHGCERCLREIRAGDDVFGLPLREELELRITGLTVCCLDCAPAVALRGGLVLVRRESPDGYPLGEWEAEQRRGSPGAR